MSTPVSSSAPRALRGHTLRQTLRSLVPGTAEDSVPTPAEAPHPAPVPALEPDDPAIDLEPCSSGPPALRPHDLARWLERHA
jgi:hypothetical protein